MSSEFVLFESQVLSLALIEKELYQLYTNLSEKVEDVSAKTLLSYIATDSLKHSTILATIIDEVGGSKAQESNCAVNIMYNKELIESLTKKVSKSKNVSRQGLISLIDTLSGFEDLLHNEYRRAFRLKFNLYADYGLRKDEEKELNIFNLIVDDEERHQKILLSLARLCDKKLSFKSDSPIVKYQRPDSWYVPPKGHRP